MNSFIILPILLAFVDRSQAGFYPPGCSKASKAEEIAADSDSHAAQAPSVVAPAPATVVAPAPAPHEGPSAVAPRPNAAPPRVVAPTTVVAAAPVPAPAPVAAPAPLLAAVPYAPAFPFPFPLPFLSTHTHTIVPRMKVRNIARSYKKESGNALKTAMVSGHGHPLIASHGLIPHGHFSVNPVLPVPLSRRKVATKKALRTRNIYGKKELNSKKTL